MKPRIDLSLLSSPVLAQMIATCAVDPLVIHIFAVDDPASIFLHESTGDHARRIRPIIGFGQSEASNYLAAGHFREVVTLLLLSTESVDRIHHQRALHGSERAHAGVAALELVHDQPVGDVVEAGAPVLIE